MSAWICDLALAAGLTFGGTCAPATVPESLPADDKAAWSYRPPEPPPPAPPPAPATPPAWPPVVIKQEVQIPVPVEVPMPPPEPKTDPAREAALDAIRASYGARTGGMGAWPGVAVPAALPKVGRNASTTLAKPQTPAMPPLDLAASVKALGDEGYDAKSVTSSLPVDNSRLVAADRYIPGVLETGINSQIEGGTGGPVVIQTTRDVFGYHGRNVLIPKGSRLICAYKSPEKVGSSRAPLRCSRILLGGHRAEIFQLKADVVDQQGRLGVTGDIDNRFTEKYGTAFILAGISAAVRGAASVSARTERFANQSDALTTSGEELSQKLGEISASALESTINLAPILTAPQGTRVVIRPDADWIIAPPQPQQG